MDNEHNRLRRPIPSGRRPVPPEHIPVQLPPTPPNDIPGRGAIPKQPGASQVTEGDIRAYFATHEFAGGPTISGEPPTIVDIKAMTSKECSDMMSTWITSVDSRPVFYVKLHGPFVLTRMSMPPPRDGGCRPVPTVEGGEEVVDAISGNRIVWSPSAI